DEHPIRTQAGVYKARVLDEDAVEANDLIEREPVLAGLQDGASPSLQAASWRPLALDLEAGPAVGQQHEAGGAGHEMGARAAHGLSRLGGEVLPEEIRERLGTPDDRTEPSVAQEIIAHAVPARQARLGREVRFRVEQVDGRGVGCVINGKG